MEKNATSDSSSRSLLSYFPICMTLHSIGYMYKVFFVLKALLNWFLLLGRYQCKFPLFKPRTIPILIKYSGGRQFHTSLRNIVNLSHKRLSTHPPIDSLKTRSQLESFFFGLQYLWKFSSMSSIFTSSSPSNERYCKPQSHRSSHVQWYITRNFSYFLPETIS